MIWIWILLGVFGCVIACMFSKLHIRFIMTRHGTDDHFLVSVKGLFGLLRLNYEAPIIQFKGIGEGLMMALGDDEAAAQDETENRVKVNIEKLRRAYEKYRELLAYTAGFVEWLNWILGKLHCTKFRWHTNVGTNDAAETAIYAGSLWVLKTAPLGYLLKRIQMEVKPDIAVNPTYNMPQFSTEAAVKFTIRLGWAILSIFRILPRILRVKGGLHTWRKIIVRTRGIRTSGT